jgi:hypothetical protein
MVNDFRQNVFDSGFLAGVCAEGGGARPILVENTFSGGDPTSQVDQALSIQEVKNPRINYQADLFASRLKVS